MRWRIGFSATRGPDESYSDVILRIVGRGEKRPRDINQLAKAAGRSHQRHRHQAGSGQMTKHLRR